MIPLRDDVPSRSLPIVTFVLIGLNVAAYVYQLSLGFAVDPAGRAAAEAFVFEFGATPCRLTATCDRGDFPSPYVTVFTSMFLHGSPLHVGGNMLYLWIFGNNIEDSMGHARFVVFYLACGVSAALAQVMLNPNSPIPMVGASGAISGVMGAYLVLYPRVRVFAMVPIGIFPISIALPAWTMLLYWAAIQFFSGVVGMMGAQDEGGVAFGAHVGGFLAGVILIKLFARPGDVRAHRSQHWEPRRVAARW